MKKKIHYSINDYIGFAKFLWKRFDEEIHVLQVASSLTYTSLLTLVPLLTVILVALAMFPMFGNVSEQFIDFINQNIVPSGASAIAQYLNDFRNAASQLTAMSIFMMLFTSLSLVQTIDQTFNRIFRIQETRPIWIQYPIYWLVLMGVPMLVGVSMLLMSEVNMLLHIPSVWKWTSQLLWDIALLYILYRMMPNRHVPYEHALIGAIFTAILFESCKWGFGIYVKNFNSYTLIYGAFAAIPVFLVWLQLLWVILLTGAVLTASLAYFRDDGYLRKPNVPSKLYDIIRILLKLDESRIQSKVLSVEDLRQVVNMDYDSLDNILLQLKKYGFIKSHKNYWLLKKLPTEITILELMSYFIYRPINNDESVNTMLAHLMEPRLHLMEMNLEEFHQKILQYENSRAYLDSY